MADEKDDNGKADDGMRQVRELIGSIREEIGTRHTDLQAKLDTIEQARETQDADLGKLREELGQIKTQAGEREQTIREIERRNLVQLQKDPAQKREHALELLGMMARDHLCRGMRVEVPAQFAGEREQVEGYLREFHQRATLAEISTAGGYFIPTVLVLDIYDTLEEVSQLLSVVDFQTGVPTKGSGVTLTGRPSLQPARASTDTAMTQGDPSFGQWTWDTDEAYIYFPVDNWMLQLSPIQVGQRMIQILRDSYVGGLCDWLINADGTAAYNSVTGMLADTVNIIRMAGTTFPSLTNADLRKLMRGVLLRARRAGAFVAGPYVIDVLEDIAREGKIPILRESADGSYRVKSKVLIEDEGMPDEDDSAADAALMGFGNPKTWGVVLAGAGIQIASDASYRFAYNQTAFRAVGHVDVVRKPGNTWALLKTKAA
jgi:HK97 family phage major capsid protein